MGGGGGINRKNPSSLFVFYDSTTYQLRFNNFLRFTGFSDPEFTKSKKLKQRRIRDKEVNHQRHLTASEFLYTRRHSFFEVLKISESCLNSCSTGSKYIFLCSHTCFLSQLAWKFYLNHALKGQCLNQLKVSFCQFPRSQQL